MDLEEIAYYIAVVDGRPNVAQQIVEEIRDACQRYAEHPLIGEVEPRVGASCRRFTHKRGVIFYRPQFDGIGVIRVLDGARDFDRLFKSN